MESKPGLLRQLLGPASHRVVQQGARGLPRASVAELGPDDTSSQQFAALVHTVWLVFASDEQLDEGEIQHLLRIIDDLTEGEASTEAVEELFDAYDRLHSEVGLAGSASLIADLLPDDELRESALKLAIGAASLDGRMTEAEERTLLVLASIFGYSSQQTQALLTLVEGSLGVSA